MARVGAENAIGVCPVSVSAGSRSIPISRPIIDQAEVDAVDRVLRSGQLAQGPVVAQFEASWAATPDNDFTY